MADPSLGSNNPFRRKSSSSTVQPPPPAAAPAAVTLPAAARLPPSLDLPFGAASAAPTAPTPPLSSRTSKPPPVFFPSEPSGPAGNPGPSPASFFSEPPLPQHHPTGDEFRDQLRAMPKVTTAAPPSTTFLKPKPVKKVRVQSPPPSSPNSVDSDFESRFPANFGADATVPTRPAASSPPYYYNSHGGGDDDDDDDDDDGSSDSDESSSSTDDDDTPAIRSIQPTAAPPNPFQKTLKDIEATDPILLGSDGASVQEKGTMDVDAFRRLLLTGQPADRSGSEAPNLPALETPRTAYGLSEAEDDRGGLVPHAPRQAAARPKPPPPSSRHGKKIQGQREDTEEGARLRARSVSDAKKAAAEAGLVDPSAVLEADVAPAAPRPPTPPNTSHAVSGTDVLGSAVTAAAAAASPPLPSTTIKKATPAPPPRRQAHVRAESRANLATPAALPVAALSPADSGRSSFDSGTVAAAGATSSAHPVPAPPPPPRRAASHTPRPSVSPKTSPATAAAAPDKDRPAVVPWPGQGISSTSSISSNQGGSSTSISSGGGTAAPPAPAAALPATVAKLAKPPPPPTRGASLRRKERPTLAAAHLHQHPHPHPQPPPPPPRARGSSRGSMDGPGTSAALPQGAATEASTAHLILADLDALQREVDALRGQYGK